MPPHPPTPDDVEHAHFMYKFFIDWWGSFLSGAILLLMGWRLKVRGGSDAIIPLSENHIDNKLTICKQAILLAINEDLDERDSRMLKRVETRDELLRKAIKQQGDDIVEHLKDIIEAGK